MKLRRLLNKKSVQLLVVGVFFILAGFIIGRISGDKSSLLPLRSITPTPFTSIEPEESLEIAKKDIFNVVKVIDGDTIQVDINGKTETVRLIGIDSPETVDLRKTVQCFGKEAAEFNKNLVLGKMVRLGKDVSETDKYGRLLRYVYTIEFEGKIFVNDALVRQGYAFAATFPPDVKYQNKFLDAQREAQENNRGLWKECPTQ